MMLKPPAGGPRQGAARTLLAVLRIGATVGTHRRTPTRRAGL